MNHFANWRRRGLPVRLISWLGVATLCLAVQTSAVDFLGGQGRLAWSPNGRWVVFNWPMKDDLFALDTQSMRTFLLKPAGDVQTDEAWVLSAESPATERERGKQRVPRNVASPGTGKLTFLEWAPDSERFGYRYAKGKRAVFSVNEGRVMQKVAASELFPWESAAEIVSEFDYVKPAAGEPARYRLRVQKRDGTLLREFWFVNVEEVSQIASMRFRDISFLANNRQFALVPRFTDAGWVIMREPILSRDAPRPVTAPVPQPPHEWKLAPDDTYLVLTDRQGLRMGPLASFAEARSVPLKNVAVTTAWSADGRFLAYQTKQTLYLWPRDGGEPKAVSDVCASRFWGWRGAQVLFGHAQNGFANLHRVHVAEGTAQSVVNAPEWQTAPREIALTNDGSKLGALVTQIDGAGRTFWQLWQVPVQPGAEWELVYAFRP